MEANLFRDKNNLLHQYPEKIVIRQDIRIVTGYPLDIILDIKAYHQYVQWISRGWTLLRGESTVRTRLVPSHPPIAYRFRPPTTRRTCDICNGKRFHKIQVIPFKEILWAILDEFWDFYIIFFVQVRTTDNSWLQLRDLCLIWTVKQLKVTEYIKTYKKRSIGSKRSQRHSVKDIPLIRVEDGRFPLIAVNPKFCHLSWHWPTSLQLHIPNFLW